jgi:hypothetical protein
LHRGILKIGIGGSQIITAQSCIAGQWQDHNSYFASLTPKPTLIITALFDKRELSTPRHRRRQPQTHTKLQEKKYTVGRRYERNCPLQQAPYKEITQQKSKAIVLKHVHCSIIYYAEKLGG